MKFDLNEALGVFAEAAPTVVDTIETVHGQAVSGVDKQAMARTALTGAVATAAGFGPAASAYAQLFGALANMVINLTVKKAKKDGTYQAASAAAAQVAPVA